MNKRGSHVGVIISFIVFIGLVVFIYSILVPSIQTGQNEQNILNYMQSAVESNISSNLTTISFNANDGGTPSCILLSNFINVAGLESPPHLVVVNSTGVIQGSKISSSTSSDLIITKSDVSSELFNAYDSLEFSQSSSSAPGSCTTLTNGTGSGTYTIGQIKTDSYVFVSLFNDLVQNYNSNYTGLKSYFKVPNNYEFGIGLTYQNGTTTETSSTIPSSTNVYAQSFPIKYVSTSGGVESGSLIIKLWK